MASQKGGSGKTTLSGHLAVQAQLSGAGPVVLIDIDPQGSLADWWNEREAELPAFAKPGQKLDITIASFNQAEAEITDDMDIDFKAYCTSLELSAGTEDNASYTATFECVTDPTFTASDNG